MSCPFPGMDPYLERASIWGDFHDSLIFCIREALVPLLRPKYMPMTQDRLYVIESERPLYPDIAVLPVSKRRARTGGATALLEPDSPAIFELWREEVRQPFLRILEKESGRIVTALEVLSPDNKRKGPGRTAYLNKRDEFWEADTNLVEIDLLHEGQPTVRVSKERLAELPPWRYLVAVTRCIPSRQEVYGIPLRKRLPRIAVPLTGDDPDVTLDLQQVFTRCWEASPYPELLRYDKSPPGRMSFEDLNWCEQLLRQAGHHPPRPKSARSRSKTKRNGK